MRLLYGQDARVARFVEAHAPHAGAGFEKYVAIGVEYGGELIGGWVFADYHGHCMQVSAAFTSPRWATPTTLFYLFGYPFLQCKVERLTAYTGASMVSVREFLKRIGFKEEGVMRRGFADDDCVVYGMLKEECRWIERKPRGEPILRSVLEPETALCA